MSIQVKELAFVFYPVTDVANARKFYEGLLGLKVALQMEIAPGQWWIEYDVADQAVAISNAMPGKPQGSLALELTDIDAALATAKSAGCPIVGDVMDFPPCRMFIVKDPDGNELMLHQRKAKA